MLRIEGLRDTIHNKLDNFLSKTNPQIRQNVGYKFEFDLKDVQCHFMFQTGRKIKHTKEVLSTSLGATYTNHTDDDNMKIEHTLKTSRSYSKSYIKTISKNREHGFNVDFLLSYFGMGLSPGYTYRTTTTSSESITIVQSLNTEKSKTIQFTLKKNTQAYIFEEDCMVDLKTSYDLFYCFSGNVNYTESWGEEESSTSTNVSTTENNSTNINNSESVTRFKATGSILLYNLLLDMPHYPTPFTFLSEELKTIPNLRTITEKIVPSGFASILKVPVKIHNLHRSIHNRIETFPDLKDEKVEAVSITQQIPISDLNNYTPSINNQQTPIITNESYSRISPTLISDKYKFSFFQRCNESPMPETLFVKRNHDLNSHDKYKLANESDRDNTIKNSNESFIIRYK